MMGHLMAIPLTFVTVALAMGADFPLLKVEAVVAGQQCKVSVSRSDQVGLRTDYWGTDGAIPVHAVSGVHITVDGVEWSCPREAFQDLAEVRYDTQVEFDKEADKGSVVLVIRGGDGAGAYAARLTLIETRIASREITSGGGFVTETVKWRDGSVASRMYANSYRAK